jgi:ribulose-5-phosphate 4-epimerase/fuculose-1-phosphate aldolase
MTRTPTFNENPPESELRELIVTSQKILYMLGLVDYLGHVSVRVAGTDRVIIKPKHSPAAHGLDTITADRLLVIDLDGNVLDGREPPAAEVYIHTEIYRARPDVLSVVHTHQPMATLLGIVGMPILPLLHVQAPLLEAPVPTFPCAELVVNQELGRGLAESLGDSALCHLQGHGIVSVARTVQDATLGAIHMEQLAEVNYRVATLGRKPRVIPPNEIANLRQFLANPAGRWAYYVSLVSQQH